MPQAHATNLQVLRPSRAKRVPGDIFVYQMSDSCFRFGRLIAQGTRVFVPEANQVEHLIYLFTGDSDSKVGYPHLDPQKLLVPPLVVNQKPWTLGYFELVERRALSASDVLPTHCFRDLRGLYYDEYGRQLSAPVEPCGQRALFSYRGVDDELSAVLGLSPAPSQPAA